MHGHELPLSSLGDPVLVSWHAEYCLHERTQSERKNSDASVESPFKLIMSIDEDSYSIVPDGIDGWKHSSYRLALSSSNQ